ncbi:MAG: sulfatase-like hydrolase/transferase, partial [Phycisphaeraceae bacterium]|nr:sulfatase-like hydrolase/transferase [Phycisphaeraceae bacterium]
MRMTCLLLVFATAGLAAPPRPDILLIVADDLGWADVGYHGSPIQTPHIDRLAKEGVELDQHYVAPVCTPTRAALLTGRYWSRFGNTTPSNERVLPWKTWTLARALKQAGYRTHITGKWHLGSKPQWGPRQFGFDRSYGSLAGGVNPTNHLYKRGPYSRTWHRNDRLIDETGHVTDLIGDEAVRFIQAESDKPLFIYVPFTAVHTPFDEPKAWLEQASSIRKDRRQYAACAQHMDAVIGRMVEALKQTGRRQNTPIIFFSDNGGTKSDDSKRYPDTKPTTRIQGLNKPLRGWKAELYEGGIRVPALVNWPGKLKASKIVTPVHVIDWMPTICGLLEIPEAPGARWDGVNLWPTLRGEADPAVRGRDLYWLGVRGKSAALRRGPWKLLVHHRKNKGGKPKIELFKLDEDPNEKNDLSEMHPD